MGQVHTEAGPEAPGVLEGRNAIKETWQQNLARCLCREDWVIASSIKIIGNAAVPVLKLQTRTVTGASMKPISLDVSFEGPGHRGLEANKLITAMMAAQPSLRPLVLVLKCFLTRRSLCESYTGGLSSYALFLMAAKFLHEAQGKSRPVPGDSDVDGVEDLGALLLGFLRFFGDNFDPRETGISVRRQCYFSRSINNALNDVIPHVPVPLQFHQHIALAKRHAFHSGRHSFNFVNAMGSSQVPFKFDPLFIEDPLEPRNNVGRNCFRIFQVQKCWSDACATVMAKLRSIEKMEIVSDENDKMERDRDLHSCSSQEHAREGSAFMPRLLDELVTTKDFL